MRFALALAALALASCSPIELPALDASADTGPDVVDAAVSETSADAGPDGGDLDAGDTGADVPPLTDAALERLYQTCEPVGSECAPGVTCVAPWPDAGTRGVCTVRCRMNPDCQRYAPDTGVYMTGTCFPPRAGEEGWCALTCSLPSATENLPCPDGGGACTPLSVGAVCRP